MDTPAPVIVEKSRWIEAPPERVWAALTQPRLIRRWMEVEPSLDADALTWRDAYVASQELERIDRLAREDA